MIEDEVDLDLLDILLEVLYDLYIDYDRVGGNVGWTFRDMRRLSPQWSVHVLQEVLRVGLRLGFLNQVGYKTYLTEQTLRLLDNHQTSWYIDGTLDLYVQAFGIERHAEEDME